MDETKRSKQEALDKRYIRMASIWAENSYCQRRQVGALIVKDKMIISDGYNGTPSGFENVCEDENNLTKPYVLHAEANAITKIARSNNSSNGATMYVTASPCIECAKLIIQAGIKRVVYSEKYRLEDGIELLKRAGIEVIYSSGHTYRNFLCQTFRRKPFGDYQRFVQQAECVTAGGRRPVCGQRQHDRSGRKSNAADIGRT